MWSLAFEDSLETSTGAKCGCLQDNDSIIMWYYFYGSYIGYNSFLSIIQGTGYHLQSSTWLWVSLWPLILHKFWTETCRDLLAESTFLSIGTTEGSIEEAFVMAASILWNSLAIRARTLQPSGEWLSLTSPEGHSWNQICGHQWHCDCYCVVVLSCIIEFLSVLNYALFTEEWGSL